MVGRSKKTLAIGVYRAKYNIDESFVNESLKKCLYKDENKNLIDYDKYIAFHLAPSVHHVR